MKTAMLPAVVRPSLYRVCFQSPKFLPVVSTRSKGRLTTRATPAAYYRGGTSRGVIFQPKHLPTDRSGWKDLFLQVMGSPDPNGRQLDGMGAGISSLSKICLVEPSKDKKVDVDYTFVGIGIESDEVDYAGNCGNMASAIGPYAFENKLMKWKLKRYKEHGMKKVYVKNTNTGVIIKSTFLGEDGRFISTGDFKIDGVSGAGSKIQLDFLKPGGAKTGKLLPTGNVVDEFEGVKASCVDAANPCIFVRADDVGVTGTILPNELNEKKDKLALLEKIREQAARKMEILLETGEVPRTIPKIAIVSPPTKQKTLSGESFEASETDLIVRFISDTQPHRAIPLTGALCTATAAKISGSIVEGCVAAKQIDPTMITIDHPSRRIQVNAEMSKSGDVISATVFRTARRIMEGQVCWHE